MAFQAPFDIVGMRKQRFLEQQAGQEQQQQQAQQLQSTIMGALGDVASVYKQNKEMEAGVKAGEMFGKTFGPQFGFDPGVYSTPEYKKMPLEAQYQFNQGMTGNLGSLTQSYNFGRGVGQRAAQPFANAQARNQQTISAQGGPTQSALPPGVNLNAIP